MTHVVNRFVLVGGVLQSAWQSAVTQCLQVARQVAGRCEADRDAQVDLVEGGKPSLAMPANSRTRQV